MRNLKILVWTLGNNVGSLNQTFSMLYSHYGIETITIPGVIGESKLFLQEKELNNISFENVVETKFDYIIVSGLNPEISIPAELKEKLAEQIKVPSETIIFDFEIYRRTFTLPKVCMVIIFNHRFDRNLPLLRKIYGKRFSDIRFLMPFYDGADNDVIPVYESSYQFQGYFIQAYDKLKNIPCTHYLFIGDDLIINPDFDEINFIARTGMYDKKFLGREFEPLNSPNKFKWHWTAGSSKSFYDTSTSWKSSLYTYEEAMSKFNDFFGEKYKEVYDMAFFGDPNVPGGTVLGGWKDTNGFLNVVNYFITTNGNTLHIPYPMAGEGCTGDIFCLDKGSMFEFSRLCGIFSAMNLFVEIAIPTATVLTFKRDNVAFFPRSSELIMWGNDRNIFADKYGRDVARLYNEWNEKFFYVHPVKLSGWKVS